MSDPTVVYAVFAQMNGGVSHHWLAVYSERENAQRFVDAQDSQLQQCLVVWEVALDSDPTDDYWATPQHQDLPDRRRPLPTFAEMKVNGRILELEARLADAEDVLRKIANDPLEPSSQKHAWQVTDHIRWCKEYGERAHRGLPEGTDGRALVSNEEGERTLGRRLVEVLQGGELLPDDAVAAIEAMRNRDRDVAALQNRIVELESKNELLRKLVAGGADEPDGRTRPAAEVLEALRAVARGERKRPPLRRAMLDTPVAQERFLSQLAQIRKGVLDPQVTDQTAADQERLRERARVLKDLEDELRRAWGWP